MLKIKGSKIVDRANKTIILRGINIGGWLMMEGYMLGGRNIAEHIFKADMAKRYGKNSMTQFTKNFRNSYFTESDIKAVKKLGFNCVRLPFNYRIVEEKEGMKYLKSIVNLFAKHKLYVILDMHAVPGSQNIDWHSDSGGRALFWEDEKQRKKYVRLWEKLAREFKNEDMIAGYDVMNEPVTKNTPLLTKVFQEVIAAIRKQGDQHIVFIEGNNWGMDIDFIEKLEDKNIAVSIHYYQPVEFTFNWLPGSTYPGNILGKKWDKKEIERIIRGFAQFAKRLKRPLYCGEFGVASRCDCCAKEYKWVDDVISLFKKYGIHWTYWTYKSVKGMPLPDGLYQLSDASGIIGNAATKSGMDNIYDIFRSRRNDLFRLLSTENFVINKKLLKILRKQLRPF
ncbi:MAG: glycoside hydrolase family 5 protein [Candidatus Margulisiibacteriota bacterium]